MAIRIALLADPHLCVQARRRNIISLLSRKPWRRLDTTLLSGTSSKPRAFTLAKPTSYDDQPLLAAADFIEEFKRELDLLLVLGDLATTGMKEDLAVAAGVFLDNRSPEHVSASLDPRFGGLGVHMHVVPGNHDRFIDDFAKPGGTEFDRVFYDIYKPINGVCVKEIYKDDVSLCVISADFCFRSNSNPVFYKRFGRGKVDGSVLNQLDYCTRQWQKSNAGRPVIWALHFSPGEGVSRLLELEERDKVTRLAKQLGVRHIFCGHTHLRKREIGTYPHIYCSGSVASIDSIGEHFLHICTVIRNGDDMFELDVVDFRYDESADEFVRFPVPRIA